MEPVVHYSPIALFIYNRPEHTKKCLESLSNNHEAKETDLYIFADGPKVGASNIDFQNILAARKIAKSFSGFARVNIIERDKNFGLAKSVILGVTEVLKKHSRVIVLEDDLVVAPHFLKFMNESLNFYEKEEAVISIHGYSYPVKEKLPETYFLKGADCWGWATWDRGWNLFNPDGKALLKEIKKRKQISEFNFDNNYPYYRMLKEQVKGKNSSWAIRWYASAFLKEKLTLYPGHSLVHNIGNDESGTHSKKTSVFDTSYLNPDPVTIGNIELEENTSVRRLISNYLGNHHSFLNRMLNILDSWISK